MEKIKKSALVLLSMIVFSSILTGCNTARGFGQDVETSGRAIERAAR